MSLLNPGEKIDPSYATGVAPFAAGGFAGSPGITSGYGNQVPTVGTGTLFFGQLGYLLPNFLPYGQLQVFGQASVAYFNAYDGPVIIPEGGLNYFISDYNVRVTLNYRARPVFEKATAADKPKQTQTKNEITLLTQFYY
jgi:hypothetical protein